MNGVRVWCAWDVMGQMRAQLQPKGGTAKKAPRMSLAAKAGAMPENAQSSRQLDSDKAKDDAENHKSVLFDCVDRLPCVFCRVSSFCVLAERKEACAPWSGVGLAAMRPTQACPCL